MSFPVPLNAWGDYAQCEKVNSEPRVRHGELVLLLLCFAFCVSSAQELTAVVPA